MSAKKATDEPKCDRCGQVLNTRYNLNPGIMTSKAPWHRDMPPKAAVCGDCAKELSDLIDKWWLKVGKTKFEERNSANKE